MIIGFSRWFEDWFGYNGLHIIGLPTIDDIETMLGNDDNPDNAHLLAYLLRLLDENTDKELNVYDDAVFLYAISFEWFLKDLKHCFPVVEAEEKCRSYSTNLFRC